MSRFPKFDNAAEALADSWASIDGKMKQFRRCKNGDELEDTEGYYQGYLCDAEEMERRLKVRGYEIVPSTTPE